eukprot:CFRG4982T1
MPGRVPTDTMSSPSASTVTAITNTTTDTTPAPGIDVSSIPAPSVSDTVDPFKRKENIPETKMKVLVADTNSLLKRVRLDNFAEKIVTVVGVVDEVRDAASRTYLKTTPFELEFREPSAESIRAVAEFSKKTGDYTALSVVDMRILALTWMMEKETKGGVAHIRTEPVKAGAKIKGGKAMVKDNKAQIGVVHSQKNKVAATGTDEATVTTTPTSKSTNVDAESASTPTPTPTATTGAPDKLADATIQKQTTKPKTNKVTGFVGKAARGGKNATEADRAGVAPTDDDGWITPNNIHKAMSAFDPFTSKTSGAHVEVGCMTTDYAMQNVLIQMNLSVVSVDGMLIRRAKSFVLRCHACFKVTTQMDKQFCPDCGNATLVKMSASVDKKGVTHYHTSRVKKVNLRGSVFSIAAPKSGRHANNLILREDQREYKQQKDKAQRQEKTYDIFADDFMDKGSPFGVSKPEINVKVGHGRRNPNVPKHTGNRKKKMSKFDN